MFTLPSSRNDPNSSIHLARLRGCPDSPKSSLVAFVISTIIWLAGSNKVKEDSFVSSAINSHGLLTEARKMCLKCSHVHSAIKGSMNYSTGNMVLCEKGNFVINIHNSVIITIMIKVFQLFICWNKIEGNKQKVKVMKYSFLFHGFILF